nr:uncharacterized protein LOC111999501 [Quercus suber]
MKKRTKEDLTQFLKKNADVFAWSHDDMPGIDPSVITHRLNVSPSSKPIRQKKRVFAPEQKKVIKEEVQKLTAAQFIREVYYPDWLANVVMIGRNVEVYVDDMLVKSLDEGSHLDDLQETFETLRRYKMKLNPSKCAFGVSSGKFLGFMVSERGIEANPDKIQAILDMEPPKNIKEVQSLTGRVAALNRFVSKATDKCLPFFKILRKVFEWTDDCQRAFQDLKQYLTTAPLLSPSVLGEELYLYLAVSPHAVSSALIREEGKVQKPVYYTSRALRGAEGRYPLIEKLAFALITASRKLRHYFQGHVINVMTDHPLKKAINKLEAAGRLIQWAVELSEFDVRYRPRNAIKAQALADFIAEFTPSYEDLDGKEDSERWVVHVDGSSTQHTGEYEALLKGLELAKSVEADSVLVLGDSQLVIGQVNETCEAKEDRMKKYLKKVLRLARKFREANFVQIPREENMKADTLAKEASANEAMDKFDEIRHMPSIDLPEMLQIEGEENWITPIVSYLRDGRLPEGKDEARKLRVRSARYILVDEIRLNLDLIDEIRMDAEQRVVRYKNLMARQNDAMVKPRCFNIGDLVLKKVSLAAKNPAHGKLGPKWEGPYRVINSKRPGSYYLEALDGRKLEHPWNVEHLRRYYQ